MDSMSRRIKWVLNARAVCVPAVLLCCCALVYANSVNSVDTAIEAEVMTITVTAGESEVINTELPTIRVSVTNPKIADVQVLTPYQVMLQGIRVGSTDMLIWSEGEEKVQRWKVNIVLAADNYQKKLRELFPDSELQVNQSEGTLIVKGLLRNTGHVEQLHDYLDKTGIEYVDMTSVAGVQQVQLQVRVAEVSRTALRTLGINAAHYGHNFYGVSQPAPSSGTPLISDITIGPDSVSTDFSSATTIFAGVASWDLQLFLQALAENQYLKILANPTLVALSGEKASFLAGGEFPIPVAQNNSTSGGTTITIEYREYGVRLIFQPFVLGDGSIRLYVMPEVSELTDVGGVTISGFSIKALLTRRFETTLELNSGQTFAMAGLMKETVSATASRVPGLGDLPVLGPLFRSVRYTKGETELVVFVTASLVEPMNLAQAPALPGLLHSDPNDWELYIKGHIEGSDPAIIHPSDAATLKEMGLDKLIGPGAWEVGSR